MSGKVEVRSGRRIGHSAKESEGGIASTGSVSGSIYTTHIKLAGSTLFGQRRMRDTRQVKDGNVKHALAIQEF